MKLPAICVYELVDLASQNLAAFRPKGDLLIPKPRPQAKASDFARAGFRGSISAAPRLCLRQFADSGTQAASESQ